MKHAEATKRKRGAKKWGLTPHRCNAASWAEPSGCPVQASWRSEAKGSKVMFVFLVSFA